MRSTVDLAPVLSFLRRLENYNERAWFEANRHEYENALGRFEEFVAALIVEISSFEDLPGVNPRDCLFRIFRDVRFSKDKTPYKPYMSAMIGPVGRRKSLHAGRRVP